MGLDASIYDDVGEKRLLSKRQGNVAVIGFLHSEISKVLPKSIMTERILYSGTHTGDELAVSDLSAVEEEIRRVEDTGVSSPAVQTFLHDLRELVQFARQHEKPIVF